MFVKKLIPFALQLLSLWQALLLSLKQNSSRSVPAASPVFTTDRRRYCQDRERQRKISTVSVLP